jgi:hypothetical protein
VGPRRRKQAAAASPAARPARAPAAAQPPAGPAATGAARLVWFALFLTLALRTAGCFVRSNWFWGWDTFGHWPPPGAVALVVLAAAGFVPPVGRLIERGLTDAGRAWERAGSRGDAAVGLVVALVLVFLRDGLRFTGDSAIRLGAIGLSMAQAGPLMRYAFPLDRLVNFDLPRLLGQQGVAPRDALQWVGAVMGGLFALACGGLLRAAGARGAALVAGAVAVLGTGLLVHFPGYDKFGPLLVGLALTARGTIALARRGRGLVALSAGAALCLLSHRSGYLALPAVAWTLWRAFHTAPGPRGRRDAALAALLVAAAAAVMLPRALDLVLHFDRATHLPGGVVAGSRAARGSAARLLGVGDAFNALSFVVPLWLAGLAAVWAPWRSGVKERAEGERRDRFSLTPPTWLALGAFGLLLFGVQPGGGWARDWDVAAPAAAIVALVGGCALVGAWSRGAAHTLAPAVTLALATSVALWGLTVSDGIGLARVEALVNARPALSDPVRANAWDFLGLHALNAGQPDSAAADFERSIECAPNPRLFHQLGLALLAAGGLERARAAFARAATLSPGNGDPWYGLARTALAARDTLGARACLDSALVRNPAHAEARALAARLSSSAVASGPGR